MCDEKKKSAVKFFNWNDLEKYFSFFYHCCFCLLCIILCVIVYNFMLTCVLSIFWLNFWWQILMFVNLDEIKTRNENLFINLCTFVRKFNFWGLTMDVKFSFISFIFKTVLYFLKERNRKKHFINCSQNHWHLMIYKVGQSNNYKSRTNIHTTFSKLYILLWYDFHPSSKFLLIKLFQEIHRLTFFPQN